MKIGIGLIKADAAIEISAGRSDEFAKQTQVLRDVIKALPLEQSQNDDLIAEIIKHAIIAETDAFKYGLSMGFELGRSLAGEKGAR